MMSSEPAIVADHAFTSGRIGQVSFETPLRPDRFYDLARAELGDGVIHSAVGTRFVFTTAIVNSETGRTFHPSACRLSNGDIRRDPSRLVFGEQLGRGASVQVWLLGLQ